MSLRFDNLVWAENEIKRGYIANETELRQFLHTLSTIDPAIGEYASGNYKKSDVFTSNKMKEMHIKLNSINDYISTHCHKSAYTFQIEVVCWKKTAMEEIAAKRNPDSFIDEVHPTCPFSCKQMSIHLHLNRSYNKSTLIDNIIKKRKRVIELAAVHGAEAEAEESDEESQNFTSNQNTFPRLCNIILDYPDAVVRSAVLASKYALQNKETNQNQPIFLETCEKFNDAAFDSGGIVSEHPELLNAKIDPEKHNNGKISPKQVFKLFNAVIR